MSHCFGAILSPLNHQYCRSTTYRFLVSSLFLVQELVALVVVQELVFQFLAVAVESSGYMLLLIYEHSLLQLVDHLFSLVEELELVEVVQLVFLVELAQLVALGLELLQLASLVAMALQLVFLAH
ncbi:Uncharacterised protein [Streptococcus pneumoniae]|nr:Uncharacterised protein [Streptococcus pneumoniae]CKG05288.1 Uncharacterised protein [Streptococcus pneumoniae]CVP46976.1 Uncharacterised protein [Streptococcus pneumoniae]SNL95879.1 Uncharacterised protein [Streptococcus pneumoniae]VJY23727.1 Uncharacterised protein [Streptococcus pneumoniae]